MDQKINYAVKRNLDYQPENRDYSYTSSQEMEWMNVLVTQSCLALCEPMDSSPPGSSVRGILQERILEWDAISFSRESSWPRDLIQASCIAGGLFTVWTTREASKDGTENNSDSNRALRTSVSRSQENFILVLCR